MDSLSFIMSIIGIVSSYGIFILSTNANLSWKFLLFTSFIFLIVLFDFYILKAEVNSVRTFLLQNQFYIFLLLPLGFLLVGIYSLKKSTIKKTSVVKIESTFIGYFKYLLNPITFSLIFFIPWSLLQLTDSIISIAYTSLLIIVFFIFSNFLLRFSKSIKLAFLNWELLGVTTVGSGLYLIFSLLMPGDYASQAKLFSPSNSEIETQYLILIAVVFILIFSAGFFIKPKNKGQKK